MVGSAPVKSGPPSVIAMITNAFSLHMIDSRSFQGPAALVGSGERALHSCTKLEALLLPSHIIECWIRNSLMSIKA